MIAQSGSTITTLECALYKALQEIGVTFERQKQIGYALVDAYVPSCNLVIEAQGDFWHCNPSIYPEGPKYQFQKSNVAQDQSRFSALRRRGIIVMELWESAVKEHGAKCLIEQVIRDIPNRDPQLAMHFTTETGKVEFRKKWTGITAHGKGYRASIGINGKQTRIGQFATPEEAARAYDVKAIEIYGDFARLNFP